MDISVYFALYLLLGILFISRSSVNIPCMLYYFYNYLTYTDVFRGRTRILGCRVRSFKTLTDATQLFSNLASPIWLPFPLFKGNIACQRGLESGHAEVTARVNSITGHAPWQLLSIYCLLSVDWLTVKDHDSQKSLAYWDRNEDTRNKILPQLQTAWTHSILGFCIWVLVTWWMKRVCEYMA